MPKWLLAVLASAVVIVLVIALAGPFGPVPGMRIGGTPTPPPANWSSVDLPEEVLLKTTGGVLPRVVTIWIVDHNDALYVFGATDSGWVKNTQADPNIELRIGDQTYALIAEALPTPDITVYQKYIDRYAANYPDIIAGMPKTSELEGAGVIFRISRGA